MVATPSMNGPKIRCASDGVTPRASCGSFFVLEVQLPCPAINLVLHVFQHFSIADAAEVFGQRDPGRVHEPTIGIADDVEGSSTRRARRGGPGDWAT